MVRYTKLLIIFIFLIVPLAGYCGMPDRGIIESVLIKVNDELEDIIFLTSDFDEMTDKFSPEF